MTGYLTNGMLFKLNDVAIIASNNFIPIEVEINERHESHFISCDKIYVDGDFNKYDLITVQLGSLSNGSEPEDIGGFSHFEIDVQIYNDGETDLQIKDRNFKLEDLSMELQARILKVAKEMYEDKMKTIVNY